MVGENVRAAISGVVNRSKGKELTRELVSNPFFPLMFIGEASKSSTFYLVGAASIEVVGISTALAIFSTICWLYTYEKVKWGLSKAAKGVEELEETVEDATDE